MTMTYRYGGIFPPGKKPTQDTTAPVLNAHEAGLREGRQQALKWVDDGLEKLGPIFVKGGWPAKALLDGIAAQVQKYLRTGDLPGTGDDE
jgi:hypothetical protein